MAARGILLFETMGPFFLVVLSSSMWITDNIAYRRPCIFALFHGCQRDLSQCTEILFHLGK